MIILLTIGYERSSDEIVDFFLYFKKEFIRINCDKLKDPNYLSYTMDVNNQKDKITIDDKAIDLEGKKVIWYRRISRRTSIDSFLNKKFDFHNTRLFSNFVFNEWNAFMKIFVKTISNNSKWFDYPYLKHDKLDILLLAKKHGFDIPETYITNEINNFTNGRFITKSIENTTSFVYNNLVYSVYTSLVKKTKTHFLPSLIQSKIEKKYEIRTFYLDGKCYSMAIFSQKDKQTSLDFRKYNYVNPNRSIPYKLPQSIEIKINKLMIDLNLKTGSLDIIKSTDGKFYFLEVNPVGQFGMTSKPCNYNLEKIIYEKIVEYENNF